MIDAIQPSDVLRALPEPFELVGTSPAVLDPARLAALGATGLLDEVAPGQPGISLFDRVARLAAHALRVPLAQVNLVTGTQQVPAAACARPPLDPADAAPGASWRTPVGLEASYCQYVVATGAPLVIGEAATHPLVARNRATRDAGIRAYLGVPLVARSGDGSAPVVLGSVCAVDFVPRPWTAEEVAALRECAELAADEVAFRLGMAERLGAAAEARDDALAELAATYAAAPVGLCVFDRELRWVRINEHLAAIHGHPPEAHIGRRVRDLLPAIADDVEPALRRVLATGAPLRDVELVGEPRADTGARRLWMAQYHPLRGADGAVVGVNAVFQEVTDARDAARRAGRLQRLTAALAAARTVDEVIAATVREGSVALDAACGVVVLLDGEGRPGAPRAAAPLAEPAREAWARLAVGTARRPGPLAQAARAGVPVLLADRDAVRRAHGRAVERAAIELDAVAVAALPLAAGRDDGDDATSVPGAVAFAWPAARQWSEAERAFLDAVSGVCAQALERARLHEAERAAAEDGRFLLALTAALQAEPVPERLAARGVRLLVDRLGVARVGLVRILAEDEHGLATRVLYVAEAQRAGGALGAAVSADAYPPDMRRGARHAPWAVDDTRTDPRTARHHARAFAPSHTGAIAIVSRWHREAHAGDLYAVDDRPHAWTPRELALLQRAGERVWGAYDVARARVDAERARAAAEVARRRAEQERERATAASRAKTEFLATMSHELRTPLNAIQGYVQLLDLGLYGEVPDEQRDVLARIDRAQRHLLRLIDDVLDHARLSAARVAFAPSAVRLGALLGDVLPMVEPQLAARDLALDVRLPDDDADEGASLVAWADRERLAQILLNLLGNAAKFATEGGRVTVTAAPAPGDAGALVVGVSDTGPGIPADRREAIFEPFVQVHGGSAYTRTVEGSGLGLAIARDLARGMGGDLWVEEAPEGGAAFRLRLPLAPRPA